MGGAVADAAASGEAGEVCVAPTHKMEVTSQKALSIVEGSSGPLDLIPLDLEALGPLDLRSLEPLDLEPPDLGPLDLGGLRPPDLETLRQPGWRALWTSTNRLRGSYISGARSGTTSMNSDNSGLIVGSLPPASH